jgi:outer membrane protein OmpA-like peptidoglycan-associated protein
MRHHHSLLAIVVAAVVSGGCATEQQTQTAIGTGVGAAAGAVVGSAVGSSGRGTAIGAAVGAGIGAAVGYNWPLVKEKLGLATKDSALNVTEQNDGALKVNIPGSVSFASGSASLSPVVYPTLDKIAGTLSEYPDTTVTVIGHSDSIGSAEANREIGRRRAAAVADYLAERGIARGRMRIETRGDLEPIADNATEAGRSQNRRVELLVRQIGS